MTPFEVRMPRLSESMAEGTIVAWLHRPGAAVRRGEELAEIETDKATVAFEADVDGVLEVLAGVGETLAVGEVIARLAPVGGGAADRDTAVPDGASLPAAGRDPGVAGAARRVPGPDGMVALPDRAPARAAISPLARRWARDLGVDLSGVTGTGPTGRVVRADVEAAAARGRSATAAPPDGAILPRTPAQRITADRLSAAASIPTFVLVADVDTTGCADLRARIGEVPGATAPTLTDLVVASAARALREHPTANAEWRDGEVVGHENVHIGVAVDTPRGLLVPTVRDAGTRSLGSISAAICDLVDRAREGRATPAELEGATFTVSNLGPFGVREFTAVLNPPQAAILAVGAARDVPVLRDGAMVGRTVMTLTLTCDHRVLDGAAAARFLARLTELLEHPLALLLEAP